MNLLDSQECSAAQESCTIVWEDETLRIEKIVSFGQVTPPEQEYCQCEAEWVSVLQWRGIT